MSNKPIIRSKHVASLKDALLWYASASEKDLIDDQGGIARVALHMHEERLMEKPKQPELEEPPLKSFDCFNKGAIRE